MERKTIPLYVALVMLSIAVLATITACSPTQNTSNKPIKENPAQIVLKKSKSQCAYTQHATYTSLWQKNQNQQNLIESLNKRIAMLEDRMSQKDGATGPIPNMIVEPSSAAATASPYDMCMGNQRLKIASDLTKENKTQESKIRALHKKATDLVVELQSKR